MSRKPQTILPDALTKGDYFRSRGPSRSPTRRPARKGGAMNGRQGQASENAAKTSPNENRLPIITSPAVSEKSDKSFNGDLVGEVTISLIDNRPSLNTGKRSGDQMHNVKIYQYIGQGKAATRTSHEFWMQNETAAKFPVAQQTISSRTPLNFAFYLDGQFFQRISVCCLNRLRTSHQIIGSKLVHFKIVDVINVVLCYRCKGHEYMRQSFKKGAPAPRSWSVPRRPVPVPILTENDKSIRVDGSAAAKRSRSISKTRSPIRTQPVAKKILVGTAAVTAVGGKALLQNGKRDQPIQPVVGVEINGLNHPQSTLSSGRHTREQELERLCEDRLSPTHPLPVNESGRTLEETQEDAGGGQKAYNYTNITRPSSVTDATNEEPEIPQNVLDVLGMNGMEAEIIINKGRSENETIENQSNLIADAKVIQQQKGNIVTLGNQAENADKIVQDAVEKLDEASRMKGTAVEDKAGDINQLNEPKQPDDALKSTTELLAAEGPSEKESSNFLTILRDEDKAQKLLIEPSNTQSVFGYAKSEHVPSSVSEEAICDAINVINSSDSGDKSRKEESMTEDAKNNLDNNETQVRDEEKNPSDIPQGDKTGEAVDTVRSVDLPEKEPAVVENLVPEEISVLLAEEPAEAVSQVRRSSGPPIIDKAEDMIELNRMPDPSDAASMVPGDFVKNNEEAQLLSDKSEPQNSEINNTSDTQMNAGVGAMNEDPIAVLWPDAIPEAEAISEDVASPVTTDGNFQWPDASESSNRRRSVAKGSRIDVEILEDDENPVEPKTNREVENGEETEDVPPLRDIPKDEMALKHEHDRMGGIPKDEIALKRQNSLQRQQSLDEAGGDTRTEFDLGNDNRVNHLQRHRSLDYTKPQKISKLNSLSLSSEEAEESPKINSAGRRPSTPHTAVELIEQLGYSDPEEVNESRSRSDTVTSISSLAQLRNPSLNDSGEHHHPQVVHTQASQDSGHELVPNEEHAKPPSTPTNAAEMISQLGFE